MRAGDEEVLRFLIADMVYQQIKEMDLNYEKVVHSKSIEIIRDVYRELERNIPDDIKLSHIYQIFDNHGILVSFDITSEDNNKSEA